MSEETYKPFLATWRGSKQTVSAGGYVHTFVVPFTEEGEAIAKLGGPWQPDEPIEVAIVRVNRKPDGTA